ncbi:hypothetical protein TD95_004624 [Thielaviopsis punctulata]|uniref:Mak10 subunit, NatC N(Alpha)-terminal acetyltransferase n=1 Tax=Thielaviopsis punctulata TaxID=72032 RepID=A0A0F4ZGF8_9PEZI|nr:hypothetical protein TD95_004624 [Thielaviopsis punctulata]
MTPLRMGLSAGSAGAVSGLVYTDITRQFRDAVQDLKPGEVVKDQNFTLFESVSALEIMDPKMDINCAEASKMPNPEYDVTMPLSPIQVLGIMDQLLSQEMAWHVGYPLALTLFTSHYIDQLLVDAPSSILKAHFSPELIGGEFCMISVLRTYCVAMIKACSMVNDHINQEHYYEEEDFVTYTYKRTLLEHIPLQAIFDDIQNTRDNLWGMAKALPPGVYEALDSRLAFRLCFLQAIESTQERGESKLIKSIWTSGVPLIDSIAKSHSLAEDMPQAFSETLQQRLSTSMPPRPIVDIGFDAGIKYLRQMFKDSLKAADVLTYSDPVTVQNFVIAFQSKRPTPLVYARAILQRYLFKDMVVLGDISIRKLIDDDLALTVLPPSILLDPMNDYYEDPQDPRFQITQEMEAFRMRVAQCYLDIYRSLCQNRCRVRRTLFHVVRDWDFLEFEAEKFDQRLGVLLVSPITTHQGSKVPLPGIDPNTYDPSWKPLTAWARLYKLKVMIWIVELGFELDVYCKHEMASMYLYLSTLCEQVRVLGSSIRSRTGFSLQTNLKTSHDTLILLQDHQLLVKSHLASALRALYTALLRVGAIASPQFPCGSDELRHELRMRPFKLKTLEPPSFSETQASQAWTAMKTVSDLLEYSAAELERARSAARQLDELVVDPARAFESGSSELHRETRGMVGRAMQEVDTQINALKKAVDEKKKIRVTVPVSDAVYAGVWTVPEVEAV